MMDPHSASFTRVLLAIAICGASSLALASPQQGPECEYHAGQTDHWAAGRVFYQVFVRSFADSDGDGIGDFRGLAARLDYLNDGDDGTTTDLGIEGIWLMPIVESPSYHGYDAVDYESVEEDYGSLQDFRAFLDAAHDRGIRVIMDLMINHTSSRHPWFESAASTPESRYRDWYIWRDEDPGWTQPWSVAQTWHKVPGTTRYFYGLFYAGMPDLNFENPAVRAEMIRVAKLWLERGVDGFRLDAARHIIEAGDEEKADGSPETHAWWQEFGAALRAEYPEVLLLGEVWDDASAVEPYFGAGPASELDMNFNFELAAAMVTAARDGRAGPLRAALCETAEHLPTHALDATFLTNHDMIRVLTQLDGDRGRARLAAGLLLTLPGVPFVYYGEEIGMLNGPGDEDPEKRTPMQWSAEGDFTTGEPWYVNRVADPAVNLADQRATADSLWHHYRQLIALRNRYPALSRGDYRTLLLSGEAAGRVLAFERRSEEQRLIVVANLSDETLTSLYVSGLADAAALRLVPLHGRSAMAAVDGEGLLLSRLPPTSVVVYEALRED